MEIFFQLLVIYILQTSTSANECKQLHMTIKNGCDMPRLKVTPTSSATSLDDDNCDVEYNKLQFEVRPKITFANVKKNRTYSIVMLDLDDPNMTEGQYYLHWIVSNVIGSDIQHGQISHTTEHYGYEKVFPTEHTGKHRFIILLFEEEKYNQKIEPPDAPENFHLVNWIRNQQYKLCGPIAGNQFKSQY